MTDKDLDALQDWKCEHYYERIMAWGNKHTYACCYCGATRMVRVGAGKQSSELAVVRSEDQR